MIDEWGERVRNWKTVFRNKNREKKRYSVWPSKDRHWNPASSSVLILKGRPALPKPIQTVKTNVTGL